MKTSPGKCRIDGVALGEINAVLIGQPAQVSAKYALVHSSSGSTCGSGTMRDWSPGTMSKFRDLISSMEDDILNMLFESAGGASGEGKEVKEPAKEDFIPEL